MHSYLEGLEALSFALFIIYAPSLCVEAAKAPTGLPEPLLFAHAISAEHS